MAYNFYLQPVNSPTDIYELHATTDIQVTFPSKVTNYPTQTGKVVSDNVVIDPETVSFTGVVTDVKQSGFSPISFVTNQFTDDQGTPKKWSEYIEDLRRLQKQKETFYVYFSGDNDGELADFEHAILTQFDINKDVSLGNAWGVNVTLQNVRYASAAEIVSEPQGAFQSKLTTTGDGSGSTSDLTAAEAEKADPRYFTAGADDYQPVYNVDAP